MNLLAGVLKKVYDPIKRIKSCKADFSVDDSLKPSYFIGNSFLTLKNDVIMM